MGGIIRQSPNLDLRDGTFTGTFSCCRGESLSLFEFKDLSDLGYPPRTLTKEELHIKIAQLIKQFKLCSLEDFAEAESAKVTSCYSSLFAYITAFNHTIDQRPISQNGGFFRSYGFGQDSHRMDFELEYRIQTSKELSPHIHNLHYR